MGLRKIVTETSAALVAGASFSAVAQHEGHDAPATAEAHAERPWVSAFEEANERMHHGMAIEYSASADVDFARGMIPHHQGAVAMARILLEYGEDPELRRLAEEIIAAQEREIAQLEAWLEANAPDEQEDHHGP